MKISSQDIYSYKEQSKKIVCLTAYDYPSARILDESGVDLILVGDSLGMVLLGHETTLPVTLDDMVHHTAAVARAVQKSCVVADMPFGAYTDPANAAKNAYRLVKEAGADSVKLEGGENVQEQVKAILELDIPVVGHIGMTPQSVEEFGGYKVQGRQPAEAEQILKDAQILDKLGVFALVVECVPSDLATQITKSVSCPTIGIGAGSGTDGQVLVLHDMLGIEGHVKPRFVRRYSNLEESMKQAVGSYIEDVRNGSFPSEEESFSS